MVQLPNFDFVVVKTSEHSLVKQVDVGHSSRQDETVKFGKFVQREDPNRVVIRGRKEQSRLVWDFLETRHLFEVRVKLMNYFLFSLKLPDNYTAWESACHEVAVFLAKDHVGNVVFVGR